MLSCRDVKSSLNPYLRGELSYPDRLEFHRHLAGCAACARLVERGRDALDVTRSAFASATDPAPGDVPESLVTAILVTSRVQV